MALKNNQMAPDPMQTEILRSLLTSAPDVPALPPLMRSCLLDRPDPKALAWRERYIESLFSILDSPNLETIRESDFSLAEHAMFYLYRALFPTRGETPFRFSPDDAATKATPEQDAPRPQ